MNTQQFAQLQALVTEIGTLTAAAELFHKAGDGAADDAANDAIGKRLEQLANLAADYLGNSRPYA